MPHRVVKYYFAFPSPFAALADSRIDDLKLSYLFEDAARWARKLGMSWNVPEPRMVDSTDAAAGYYFARTQGNERGYRNAVFRARWSEGKNIADRQVLAACAEQAGLPRAEFLEALDDTRYRDEVPKALLRCMEDRIFGVPIFIVDGKRFWGNDRLDFLIEELRRG